MQDFNANVEALMWVKFETGTTNSQRDQLVSSLKQAKNHEHIFREQKGNQSDMEKFK